MSAILTIIKQGENGIRFALEHRQPKPFAGPTQEVWVVKVDRPTLLTFCQAMYEATEETDRNVETADLDPFVRAGGGLLRELLPETDPRVRELLAKLRRVKSPLLISTDEPNLFWELLYDSAQKAFFGLRFQLGRRLMTQEVPANPLRFRRNWRCLLIADPSGNLPQAARETVQLRDWLEQRGFKEIDYLSGAEADFKSVLAALSGNTYDIVHFAGHTTLDRKTGEYALELHSGEMFRASLIRRHLKGASIVFLNGCWTGIARGLANAPGSVVGLTDAFLAAGAQVVVGSQFKAPDAGARAFAEKFYELLLEGECVGEAMRRARCHVQTAPGCGAAWACFISYGDPAAQLKPSVDPVGRLLGSAKLKSDQFDAAALSVVRQALEYAGKSDLVATIELFAALVDSPSGLLRARLEEQDVPVKELARAFKSRLEEINTSPEVLAARKKGKGPRFTDNAQEIVVEALSFAKCNADGRISERDIIRSFVRKKGGNTGKILEELNIDIQRLDRIDGLSPTNFTEGAWTTLMNACALAARLPEPLVGGPQLFLALQQDPKGQLACALTRLNLQVLLANSHFILNGEKDTLAPPKSFPANLPISGTLRTVLLDARAAVESESRQRISERDLLLAFVRSGGGTIGRILKTQVNLLPEALASDLFLSTNEFDLARLAPSLHGPLKGARNIALKAGHGMLGRRHIFCALLGDSQSLLAEALREQGHDAAQLSSKLASALKSRIAASHVKTVPERISIDLANVFAVAETEMRKWQQKILSEPLLLICLLARSEDLERQFFRPRGVDWSRLIQVIREPGDFDLPI